MTESGTSTVKTLTAEVRVLMVGNRQITQSVYKQLDWEPPDLIDPFGRVRTANPPTPGPRFGFTPLTKCVELVGVSDCGQLVRSHFFYADCDHSHHAPCHHHNPSLHLDRNSSTFHLLQLPLIVLAGLR